MVGTKSSGNRTKGDRNNITLFTDKTELDFIRSLPHPNGVAHYQIIMKEFLENHKEEFIEFHSKAWGREKAEEMYNERIKIRSMNATEGTKRKEEIEKDKIDKRERELALEELKAENKKRELDLREQNIEYRNDKQSDEEFENLRDERNNLERKLKELGSLSAENLEKEYPNKTRKEVDQDLTIKLEIVKKRLEELKNA